MVIWIAESLLEIVRMSGEVHIAHSTFETFIYANLGSLLVAGLDGYWDFPKLRLVDQVKFPKSKIMLQSRCIFFELIIEIGSRL